MRLSSGSLKPVAADLSHREAPMGSRRRPTALLQLRPVHGGAVTGPAAHPEPSRDKPAAGHVQRATWRLPTLLPADLSRHAEEKEPRRAEPINQFQLLDPRHTAPPTRPDQQVQTTSPKPTNSDPGHTRTARDKPVAGHLQTGPVAAPERPSGRSVPVPPRGEEGTRPRQPVDRLQAHPPGPPLHAPAQTYTTPQPLRDKPAAGHFQGGHVAAPDAPAGRSVPSLGG